MPRPFLAGFAAGIANLGIVSTSPVAHLIMGTIGQVTLDVEKPAARLYFPGIPLSVTVA
jgi:hypothetical protein